MRYQIKQKMISIGDDFYVYNEHGERIYFIDGYGYSFGNKLAFKDMQGKQLFLITQRLFTFRPTYRIWEKGKIVAVIKKAFMPFRNIFTMELFNTKETFKIVGRFIEHEYKFFKSNKLVAESTKRWFKATDTYTVEITGTGHHTLVLAACVVVDMICHDKQSKYDR